MIEACDIVKTYGHRTVLDGASFTVGPGECVVLTGDNGSGKTTLLHAMVGLRNIDSGGILWHDCRLTGAGRRTWQRARAAWGFLPQQVVLPPTTPVERLLRFYARLRGMNTRPAYEWLERVGLNGTEKQRVQALSGGMQQRLGIALTFFCEPDLIIMDEPASSLDPGWRGQLTTWVAEQTQRGAGVLVTSQLHETWGESVRFLHCEAGRIVDRHENSEAQP
ncbi:MAG: ABC transporter ATP-binding protein [Phycisphaeraceae bacterium]